MKISLIIPVYNEAENLGWHHDVIKKFLAKKSYKHEIIYVNDGSSDKSLEIIKRLAEQDTSTRYLSFSRNFGKEAATTAGIRSSGGDAVILIDADGQHPIDKIDEFIHLWESGSQVVIGVRKTNMKEGFIKRYGSKLFYRVLNAISEGETIPQSTDFRLLDRKVVDEFNRLTERNRITRGLIDWLGFKRAIVEFDAPARQKGQASYSLGKLMRLALHAFVSQTTRPLQLAGVLGLLTVFLSFIVAVFLLIEKYALGDPLNLAVTGTAFLALFVSFLVGLVLICQWLLALYIESIHNETQNRPLYIVDEEE